MAISDKDYTFILDLKAPSDIPLMTFVRGDINTGVINIYLTENGIAVPLTSLVVGMAFKKPDNTLVLQDVNSGISIVNATTGLIKCILRTQTIAAVGDVWATVSLTDSSNNKVTFPEFKFKVKANYDTDDAIVSTNEFSNLTIATTNANNAIGTMNTLIGDTKTIGIYDIETPYKKYNRVTLNGSSFEAKVDTLGNSPDTTGIDNTWWYCICKKGDKGDTGDSVVVEYSIDGSTLWHSDFTSGDIYMHIKVGLGDFGDSIKIVGDQGIQGDSVTIEYSIDGSTLWHSTFATGDIYMRIKIGSGAWSDAIRIVGEKGDEPAHQWSGTSLQFQNPDGSWGDLVNLRGEPGTGNGTVTEVSSANADISVATGTTTPVLTLNSGTGANQILKLDADAKIPAVNGSQLTNMTKSQVGLSNVQNIDTTVAGNIDIVDVGDHFISDNVEGALQELAERPGGSSEAVDVSIADVGDKFIATNVEDALAESADKIGDLSTKSANKALKASSIDINPLLINMHFKTLKGFGWVSEDTNINTYPVTLASSKGNKVINCNSPETIFVAPQLIVYKGVDGNYYSNVIASFGINLINTIYPLEADVDTTCSIMHFYSGYSHPNKWGYYAICDYAIREFSKSSSNLIFRFFPTEYTAIGSNVVFTTGRLLTYYVQGFGKFDTRIATITVQNEGIQKTFIIRNPGNYKVSMNLNTVADGEIRVEIVDASSNVMASKVLNNSGYNSTEEFLVNLEVGQYTIKMTSQKSSGTAYIYLGKTEIFYLDKKYEHSQLNRGTHLLLGDSWFDNDYFIERLQVQLSDANITNFGVGGNQMENITRRFIGTATDADIANNPTTYGGRKDATTIDKIDYVWVMCGTNDFYSNKTADVYQSQMKTLINHIVARNAKPLVFTASVGDKNDTAVTGYQLFDLSRQYADFYINYNNNNNSSNDAQHIVVNFNNVSVPTGVDTVLGIGGVAWEYQHVYIQEICFNYEINKDLAINFQGGIAIGDAVSKTQLFSTAYTFLAEVDFGTPSTGQFLGVIAKNTTGTTKIYSGYVKFRIE